MPSKTEQILDLLEKTDLSNKEIAERVGCVAAYVRTVQQRLLHGRGNTASNIAWRNKNRDRYNQIAMRYYYKRKQAMATA